MSITRDDEIRIRGQGAFEDAIVVGIVADGVNCDLRNDKFPHPPHNRQHMLQSGRRPTKFLR